jgi:hypothetical protein
MCTTVPHDLRDVLTMVLRLQTLYYRGCKWRGVFLRGGVVNTDLDRWTSGNEPGAVGRLVRRKRPPVCVGMPRHSRRPSCS